MPRLLTLVRHAKSSWDDPGLDDFERPLNARGLRDAPVMARRAEEMLGTPNRLVTSPARRAITTARVFAEALGIGAGDIEVQPTIYEADASALFAVVRARDDGAPHVMLFGHNPGFTDLAHELAHCPFREMPTCAFVQLELAIETWRETRDGVAKVLHYAYPKQDRP